jgi:hypothetical protein
MVGMDVEVSMRCSVSGGLDASIVGIIRVEAKRSMMCMFEFIHLVM